MELLIMLILAGAAGWKLSALWYQIAFQRLLKELNVSEDQLRKVARDAGIELDEPETDPESPDLPELELRIERNDDGLFAYRKDNDQFIAQGNTPEHLMENLINNLNNVRVVVHKEDGAEHLPQQS